MLTDLLCLLTFQLWVLLCSYWCFWRAKHNALRYCFIDWRCFSSSVFMLRQSYLICHQSLIQMHWLLMTWWTGVMRSWWWHVTSTTSFHHYVVQSSRQWRCSMSCILRLATALCTLATAAMQTSTLVTTAQSVTWVTQSYSSLALPNV